MSYPQDQAENTIVPSEEINTERQLPLNTGQLHINVINVHQHIQHQNVRQVIQQDNRQYPTAYNIQPKELAVRSGDDEGQSKTFRKLKEATGKLYLSKFDVDVSKFGISTTQLPEIYPELFSVDFYEGRCIPNDDQYDPKSETIKFKASDKEVTIDELVSQFKSHNFISIVGYPGAGKTTLSKRLARLLDQTEDFIVLKIPFMNMSDGDDVKLTLKEFLLGDVNLNLEENEKELLFNWIKNHTQNFFLILDGFDQVNWNLLENAKKADYNTSLTYTELVSNLCQGIFLLNCHIVFTSRPHAMLKIPQKCRPKQTYFIRDLTSTNMKKLFYAFSNDEEKASELWHKLTVKTPHLESMCHNPLMLQLYLRASLSSSHNTANITSMTRIFYTVLENLNASRHAISLSDDIVIKLSKIAFKATKNKTVLITIKDLQEENLTSELVQTLVVTLLGSNRNCGLLEGNRRLYFSHQTFQEFFAALYIIHQMSLKNFASFVENKLWGDHWSVVVQFLSGLILDPCMNKDVQPKKKKIFFSELYEKTRKIAESHSNFHSIINISKILRECSNDEVIIKTCTCFDGGWIWMNKSTSTQNDFHEVTSFLKLIPGRVGKLNLFGLKMNSEEFLRWAEAIISMPGSIVWLYLRGNRLSSVDDVIKILHKIDKVDMHHCLEGRRDPNEEERAKLQETLNRMGNKKLEIYLGNGLTLKSTKIFN